MTDCYRVDPLDHRNENKMELEQLGFSEWFRDRWREALLPGNLPARVIEVNRGNCIVKFDERELPAELTGNFLFSALSNSDMPCVGDWVTIRLCDNDTWALIQELLPRKSFLRRKTPGRVVDYQMIATNIDTAFIVQACDYDFNIRRLERYLVMVREGGIAPLVLLSKCDLIDSGELEGKIARIRDSAIDCRIVALSNRTGRGLDEVGNLMVPGRTYCLIGSSGVGKTTLLNRMIGSDRLETGSVRNLKGKGRHITTRRQLVLLKNGSMMIDTPGMRELGNLEISRGLEESFADISDLAGKCLFTDCTHRNQKGCALLKAVEEGTLSPERYESYLKLRNESEFHQLSFLEKRQKEKNFGKLCKSVLKHHRKSK